MNSHLNIFKTYTNETRRYQLENDLTRAFAICLQENTLFFNEVLKSILDPVDANELFSDIYSKNEITINIQRRSSEISGFDKIYAVSLSEHEMTEEHFWNQKHDAKYDPICDLVININGKAIIVEAKRDNSDCTAQLWNQAFNICNNDDDSTEDMRSIVTPKDLNWFKLMNIAVKVHSFEKATGHQDRFLKDFISLVKGHNFRWLPEPSISSVSSDNRKAITQRIDSTLNELCKNSEFEKLQYSNRLGLRFDQLWAEEILFKVSKTGDLTIQVYPGNTKTQGKNIFKDGIGIKNEIIINEVKYPVNVMHHIKFQGQSYISGLWFEHDKMKKNLYTRENFIKYCGRKYRKTDWNDIERLFDDSFKDDFNWKEQSQWENKIINSNRKRFDLSFGYELSITIPFEELRKRDQNKDDLTAMTNFFECVYNKFRTVIS
jgi:hypothetical protein